jgi:dTDP-4-dehydrorhamnose 3,5-epimerase
MEVTKTKLDGVLLIKPPTHFEDFRGEYVELYNEDLYTQAGVNVKFMQDDISVSSRHVLRGIHGDQTTWKLVTCLQGTFYLVVLDYRKDSPQFGQWIAVTLSDKNRLQVLIPPGFGNGHVVMSEQSVFHYKQSTYYNRAGQFTVRWNDPEFKIFWPVSAPIVSQRDLG